MNSPKKPQPTVITIDGPSGSGKSTVACKLAKRLAFVHLNSGALYRIVGVEAKRRGLDLRDPRGLLRLTETFSFRCDVDAEGRTTLLCNGQPVTSEIFTEEAGRLASGVGLLGEVREKLNHAQRLIAAEARGVVAEGRDAGTVVFPDARLKFYLDADARERARRRFAQLSSDSSSLSLEEIERAMLERDRRDSTRAIAPQVPADDAIHVDTTGQSADEVVDEIVRRISSLR